MEGQPSKGQSQHSYSSQQWSKLVRRNTLAAPTTTPSFPPSALVQPPLVSTTIEAFPDLLPQQACAYRAQLAQYNKLIASNTSRASRVQSSPLPPLLSRQHIQAVPRSGTSGHETRQRTTSTSRVGHGNKKPNTTGTGERPLIAADLHRVNQANMAYKKSEAPKQPAKTQHQHTAHGQHSSSVPSTPHQRARKFSTASREPSPIPATNHSPRSAYSESNTAILPYRPLEQRLGNCGFETALQHFKRRIPYSNGSDPLPRTEEGTVEERLSGNEQGKLSEELQELYDQLRPTCENEERRNLFILKLQRLLNTEWPGHQIEVHVFGSSGNMLCTDDSDIDMCIVTDWKGPKEQLNTCMLADMLSKRGMTNITCVSTAKVPIVKAFDPVLNFACDMNINNTEALKNTKMIKTYVQIDERVRPLAMIVKYWAKKRVLNDAAFGGTLSSYTWICMVIYFLQLRKPAILPSLHKIWQERNPGHEEDRSGFADNLEELQGFGTDNTENLGDLVFHFFRFYAYEFDYRTDVVSIRVGGPVHKKDKGWAHIHKDTLCVEEPFNIGRNLANTADDFSFRGIHQELRQAFDLISEARFQECCKQYEFPEEPRAPARTSVAQAPRPLVISRSASQTRNGRSGHGMGGSNRGRGANQLRSGGPSARRASSVTTTYDNASTNGYSVHAAHSAPPLPTMTQADPWLSNQQAQVQLHELYMSLEAQKDNLLRLQLMNQEQGFQQAKSRIDAFAQAQRQHANGSITTQHTTDRNRGMSFDTHQPPSSAPLYYFFPVPPYQQAQMYQQQGNSNTYPPSPSMPPAIPEQRRSLHRPSVGQGSSQPNTMTNSTLRSHSQPAVRTNFTPFPFQYGVQHMQQQVNGPMPHGHVPFDHADNMCETGQRSERYESNGDSGLEKDYKGYAFNGAIVYQNHIEAAVHPVASSSRRRLSTEQYPQAVLERLQRGSRSPSPHGRAPAYSAGSRSIPTLGRLPQSTFAGSTKAPNGQIPLVVNGSYPAYVPRDSAGPSSLGGSSSSGEQFHDALSESFDSLNFGQIDSSARGHAETFGLGVSFDESRSPMNGVSVADTQLAAPKLTSIPKLGPLRVSPGSTSPNGSERVSREESEAPSQDTRSRASKHHAGSGSPKGNGIGRGDTFRDNQPHLSPVYEGRAPASSNSGKTEGQSSGRRPTVSAETKRAVRRALDNGTTQKPSSPVKSHTRSARSEGFNNGNSHGSWSQIPKGKKKNLGIDRNKGNVVQVGNEELPKRDSERKGG